MTGEDELTISAAIESTEKVTTPPAVGNSAQLVGNGWNRSDAIACAAVTAVFCAALLVWFAWDHRVPCTDEAGHILSALSYKELLRHPKFWKIDWLRQVLSVSSFYPPSIYIFNGALKLLFGNGRGIDIASMVIFSAILSGSTYGIARFITRSTAVATTAVVVLNLYPQIAHLSHVYLLDFPLSAMVAAGLCAMLWWQERPTWRRALVAAAVLAAACMSKQIAAGFLFVPGCWLLWQAVSQDRNTTSGGMVRNSHSLQVLAMAAVVLAVFAPWLMVNYSWIHGYAQENAANMGGLGVKLSPLSVLIDYAVGLWHSMSPLLGLSLVAAVVFITAEQHKRLAPLYCFGIGGLVAISFLTCTFPLDRYASSVLIMLAVVTAYGVVNSIMAEGPRLRATYKVAWAAVLMIAALQYVSFGFSPAPIAQPLIATVAPSLGVYLREFRGVRVERSLPTPASVDWGQQWAIDQIKNTEHNNTVWLNILPSHGAYNPHSFELLAKECNANVLPTTSRYWTIVGDRVSFSPHSALYYQWYLVKTGDQGNKLRDPVSEDNFAKLTAFVTNGAHYTLRGQRRVADGSTISLYKLVRY